MLHPFINYILYFKCVHGYIRGRIFFLLFINMYDSFHKRTNYFKNSLTPKPLMSFPWKKKKIKHVQRKVAHKSSGPFSSLAIHLECHLLNRTYSWYTWKGNSIGSFSKLTSIYSSLESLSDTHFLNVCSILGTVSTSYGLSWNLTRIQ